MNHEEWLKWRNKGLGSSDCSAIIGKNPFMTNVELWEDKALNKKKEFKSTEVLERGHKVEPLIREMFAIDNPKFEVFYKDNDHFECKIHPFRRATLDGRLTEKSTSLKGVLEIKHVEICNAQQRLKWKDGKIPDNYFCQVLHQLDVTGYDFAILKARFKNVFGEDIYISEKQYRIDKEDFKSDMEYLRSKEVEFWTKYVVPKMKPHLILPSI